MGKLKWYKRDPRAAILGMAGMSLEECGAYNKILDLIYINDGALPDNPKYICNILDCDPRIWNRIKARLLDLGKIYIHAGTIRNERADDEAAKALGRVQVAAEMADKRWSTYRKINNLADAKAMLTTTTYTNLLSFLPSKKKEHPKK